jgi:site-specific DNA recombinase
VSLANSSIPGITTADAETADDPSGHLMETIYAGFDQYESEMNGYRTTAAMRENARRGFINGSLAPFGFCARLVDVGGGPKRRKLFPEPTEVEMVREIFRLYIGHRGAKAVARELNQRGLRCRGGKLWTKDLVLRIVEETAAIGTYNWGRADSRTGKLRDRSEWIAIAVEPIIDRDLFEAAERVRESRDPRRAPGRTSSSPLMLAGLIKCGVCGASYVLETSGKADPEGAHTYRYYNCRSFVKTGKEACAGRRIPIKKLDRAVLEHLADQIFSVDRCRALVRDIVEETGILRQKTDEQRRDLQRQVESIDGRIAKWEEAFETNAEAADVIMPKLRELRQKRNEIASTIAKIVPLRPPPSHLYSAATIQRFQDTVRQLLLSDDPTLAKNYLRFLVDQIVVRGNEVEIRGKTQAAVALLSAGSEGTCLATVKRPAEVLTSGGGWLQRQDSNLGPGG